MQGRLIDPHAAAAEAGRLLDPASDRWAHTVAVAARAETITRAVPPADRDLLVAAAWLHDIGYAPPLAQTGLHPLDGARHLRAVGADPRLCRLVAHHTGAIVEAEARGLADRLGSQFPPEQSIVADALTYADLTTGPQGQPMTVQQRLTEILHRYPTGHVVHQAITRARPLLLAATGRVERQLASPR